ncbi:MAG: hypothetical protein M3Q46_01350 [Verrucomicrobiota bacterium]|nr:hypothetical protein [Verrucomicrobiota bacterium]
MIRVLGPTLADAGFTGALDDPTVELYDASGNLVASNNDWRDTQESEIIATGLAPADDREPAIAAILSPGPFATVVSGANSTIGLAFSQIYSLAFPVKELDPAPKLRRGR